MVSSKFFDTQVPSISTEKLVLSRHARCVLSRLHCNKHSLLLSAYLFRIGRIGNPSCSACGHSSQKSLISFYTVQLRTLCIARSLVTLCLFTTSGAPWSSAMLASLRRSRVTTTTVSTMQFQIFYGFK